MERWYKNIRVIASSAYMANFLVNSGLAFKTGLEIEDKKETATIEERRELQKDWGIYIRNMIIPFYGSLTRDEE